MSDTINIISPEELSRLIGTERCPLLIDARRRPVYEQAERVIAGSRWLDIQALDRWVSALPADRAVVVYCVHGHNVSQSAATWLNMAGRAARMLDGGIEGFADAGGMTVNRAAVPAHDTDLPSHWVTAGDLTLDRLACAWLIHRFVDPRAAVHWVEADQAAAVAADIGGTVFAHNEAEAAKSGQGLGFTALLQDLDVQDGVLASLAAILRASDDTSENLINRRDGLAVIASGLSLLHADARDAIERVLPLFDALFAASRMPQRFDQGSSS